MTVASLVWHPISFKLQAQGGQPRKLQIWAAPIAAIARAAAVRLRVLASVPGFKSCTRSSVAKSEPIVSDP